MRHARRPEAVPQALRDLAEGLPHRRCRDIVIQGADIEKVALELDRAQEPGGHAGKLPDRWSSLGMCRLLIVDIGEGHHDGAAAPREETLHCRRLVDECYPSGVGCVHFQSRTNVIFRQLENLARRARPTLTSRRVSVSSFGRIEPVVCRAVLEQCSGDFRFDLSSERIDRFESTVRALPLADRLNEGQSH